MSERNQPEPPQYAVEQIRQALASDPRTSELGVQVSVRADVAYLDGEVTGAARAQALTEVARDAGAGLQVHNRVRVTEARGPSTAEELR
ncbi:BON domain-containing protein [Actinoalloteichus hymeniacidonis]|uniref:Phospholipid-binding protein n=1 Tax=Actinoalloteichus hymeniacidonis TaxID=340345 RepID=A0AAC9MYJ0_9PSEU|nr:BON domain-containing protein [Actinoalloteichus hymeniacidonis]AOS63032.1 putative phospholipid-binding protein [Actinoalloteichus hymeniacidonis]MBB5908933.1 osmotically-inducible protein OsmY [Actinoalloteichus hymeniacidonis]